VGVAQSATGDELVVLLIAPSARFRALWLVAGALLVAGLVVWTVLAPGWQAFLYAGILIPSYAWVTALSHKSRRLARGRAWTLTADSDGLRTPLWAISWDRVESMSIEQMHGRVRALRIEIFQPSDLVLPSSTVLAINA
jgi:hypothetical protein